LNVLFTENPTMNYASFNILSTNQ